MAPVRGGGARTTLTLPAPGRWRPLCARLTHLLMATLALAVAQAERIEIDTGGDPDSRLEIRNVVLPGGVEAELYVLRGSNLRVTIGEQEISAQHIEVDLTSRVVRIIGPGSFATAEQTIFGEDLVIELEHETIGGRDVLIATEAIDVKGAEAARVPGQIDVLRGQFSPCSRCGQEVEDFGFRAARIELYPGDRLVAFDATLLVRETPTLQLPVLVVPLARPERQPRLAVSQGSANERAEVTLDWPYVSGADAYGTFSVRYFADVDPIPGGGLQPLGGRVTQSYLGGGIDHFFFTDRGSGNLTLFYRPGFLRDGAREREEFTVRFAYATDDEAPEPQEPAPPRLDIEVVRDDSRRQRLLEYRVDLGGSRSGLRGRFTSEGFADLDPDDQVVAPSYDTRAMPRRTPARLVIEPETERFSIGPLLLRRLALDLGAFEDESNPTNRSAAGQPLVSAGRALERHAVELRPVDLWNGMELSGFTNFTGYYYTTAERQIDWQTRLSGRQRFGSAGTLGVTFNRDVKEGETPFRFDQIPLRTRTDLQASLRLQPLPWLAIEADETYVVRDSRRPELEGFGPLETRLRLFDDRTWLDFTVANRYDIADGDPGTLDFELRIRAPEASPRAELEVVHTQDLAVLPDRLSGEPVDETSTRVSWRYGAGAFSVDASGGFRYRPPEPEEPDERPEQWLPFRVGLTLGTLEQRDGLPGLRLAYERNLNLRRVEQLSYEATARLGPVEVAASQNFDLPDGGTSRSSFAVAYPGVARFEATGFTLVRPAWLGLPPGEPRNTLYTVSLSHAPAMGQEQWQVRYLTRFNPLLVDGEGGFENTTLEGRVRLEEERVAASRFSVDMFVDLQLADDRLERSYLRRASLQFAADIEERVGLQGSLGYRGTFSAAAGEVTRAELNIDDVAVTVRVRDDLFLGALFDDVWDITGRTAAEAPFDLRPELFVVWDRCCWALMGAWNTETGAVRLSLTAPGAEQGVTQVVDTPLVLPGRGE